LALLTLAAWGKFPISIMSAIASFVQLPKSGLHGLRLAATQPTYHEFLKQHGKEVADYRWSGYVLGTLLVCLKNQHQIDLMKSEFDELSAFLTKSRGATHFVFSYAHKLDYKAKLDGDFSEQSLCDYYNEFNGSAEKEAGKPMLDGVQAFRKSVSALDADSVVVFSSG
jgi:hypothetical protein